MTVHIWTDGACSPNPGNGGWGAVLSFSGRPDRHISGHEAATTNNRMEMLAVIRALQSIPVDEEVIITTDSQYVANPFTKHWIERWRLTDYDGRPNADLWRLLYRLVQQHRVTWIWVRGHRDNLRQNTADKLAVAARLALSAEEGVEHELSTNGSDSQERATVDR